MAVDMFLKLDGIKGESKDHKYPGWIDVMSWSWGMSQSGTTHAGTGGGAGKVSVSDLTVMSFVNRASPELLLACASGKHFKEATLVMRKAGDKPVDYLKITMTEVLISSVSDSGASGGDLPTESLSLNFAKYKFAYTPQKDDGSADAVVETGWDIPANKKF